jgi:hypothetical protein
MDLELPPANRMIEMLDSGFLMETYLTGYAHTPMGMYSIFLQLLPPAIKSLSSNAHGVLILDHQSW